MYKLSSFRIYEQLSSRGFSRRKWNNFLGYESVSTVFVNALYSYAYLVAFQVNDLRTRYSQTLAVETTNLPDVILHHIL